MASPISLTPQKRRSALEQLSRNRLTNLSEHFGLDVGDRRVAENHISALAQSTSVDFGELLGLLKREELEAICEVLGLERNGRGKDVLVKRILADGSEPRSNPGSGKAKRASKAIDLQQIDDSAVRTLSVDQLERHLWSAADILRGSIDSSDYKNFIFGLLFLKRISDVFEEEAERLVAEGHRPEVAWEDKDEHQFFVPKAARWSEIQNVASNIGEALNKACAKLEEQNSALDGILAGIDFNDERKLGDTKNRDAVLSRLVQHFSKISLRNSSLAEPDMLGRAYEYLIEKFADDAGKKGGEFYTPKKVVELIVELLRPTEDMRICDPTCGSGGMLIECANYVKRHGGNPRKLSLHGQEKNLGTWAIAKMNMLLHGLSDHRIEKGDTIRSPKLVEASGLLLYDRVIANPPFSLDEWGVEVAEADAHGRFRFGIPPKTKGDLAFLQHMVATLNGEQGQLGVVMPHGVLFRGGSEADIRKGFLQEDLVEAVIGLGPNLFYGTGIPAAVLVMNRAKPPERRGKVLFVHGAEQMVPSTSQQNTLSTENIAVLAGCFREFQDKPRLARVVTLEQIAANDFSLNISRYVDVGTEQEGIDLSEAVKRLRALQAERSQAEARLEQVLRELGYGAV